MIQETDGYGNSVKCSILIGQYESVSLISLEISLSGQQSGFCSCAEQNYFHSSVTIVTGMSIVG